MSLLLLFGSAGTTTILALDPASVNLTGQTHTFSTAAALDPATVNFAGQSIAHIVTLSVDGAASVNFTGQALSPSVLLSLDPASVTFSGQSLNLLDLSPSGATRAPLYLPASGGRMASIWKGIRGS